MRATWIALTVTAALSAAVLVALPMYHDHAIYWHGGQQLLMGKLADDDLVKQPGIYLIFATAKLLWGDHEWSYRLLDACLQVLTAALLATIAHRLGSNELAAITAVVYLLTYAANAFVLGSHPESYLGIPIALIALLRMCYQPVWPRAVLEGIVLVIALWLKITFAVIGLGLLLLDFSRHKHWHTASYWIIVCATICMVSAVGLALLWQRIDWSTLPAALEYLRFYAATPPVSVALLSDAWHRLLRSASDHFSIAWVSASVIGWLFLVRHRDTRVELWAMLTLAISVSIVLERKFGVVHLWRLLPLLALPIAAGLLEGMRVFRVRWTESNTIVRAAVLLPMVAGVVLFSPIPRFIQLMGLPLDALRDQTRYNALFQRPAHNILHRQTLWDIAGFIQSHRQRQERVLVLSACMSQLYFFLQEPPWYHFSTTLPIYSAFVPAEWRQLYRRDLRSADWVVIATLDRAWWLFGHARSSWESLRHDQWSARYLDSHFTAVLKTDIAIVFRRTQPDVEQRVHVP